MRTGKRGFDFSRIRNSKIIDCEHVIVQRVLLLFFPVEFYQTIPNNVTKIVEITCAIYSKRRLCKEYIGRKV